MTLEEIYQHYTPGSPGFAIAVESHCGYGITRSEIQRIGEKAKTADEFQDQWENDDWWQDDKH